MGIFKRNTTENKEVLLTEEGIIHELLRERKKDRRNSLIKVVLFALLGLVYVGWMALMFSSPRTIGPPKEPFAAIVKVTGQIGEGKSASYEKLAPLLRKAFKDERTVGVVLQINSPGGTPVQSAMIHDLIVELKQETGKPVVAVGEDVMASGAYMIAVAADVIAANRSSVVGSIGVISAGFGFTDMIEKIGVERRVITAGESKNMMDPFSPVNPKADSIRKEMIQSVHNHFKEIVMEGRQGKLDLTASDLFEGAVWTGDKGLQLGLIDDLGRVDTIVKEYLGTSKIFTYKSSSNVIQNLLRGMSVELSNQLVKVLKPEAPVLTLYQ